MSSMLYIWGEGEGLFFSILRVSLPWFDAPQCS